RLRIDRRAGGLHRSPFRHMTGEEIAGGLPPRMSRAKTRAGIDGRRLSRYDHTALTITASGRQISFAAIRDAATAVYEAAIRTPLVQVGPTLYLKLETLQPIGSFKIRGAYNVVRQLAPEQLKAGVWTVSAGNAAQGVALAAQKAGARCSVM